MLEGNVKMRNKNFQRGILDDCRIATDVIERCEFCAGGSILLKEGLKMLPSFFVASTFPTFNLPFV